MPPVFSTRSRHFYNRQTLGGAARVEHAAVVIAQVARRHDTKASDEAQRTRFRTSKAVLVVQVVDELALVTARQIEVIDRNVS